MYINVRGKMTVEIQHYNFVVLQCYSIIIIIAAFNHYVNNNKELNTEYTESAHLYMCNIYMVEN